MIYETIIGLEVHVELATETKLFCSCSAKFGADPNENVCPACAGMPGMPAVANKRAVELGIAAGLVTNSQITPVITFDKKNYYYPDLPAGYQITQWAAPVCTKGWVEVETSQGTKLITLKQIHIEEDAGKLVHDQRTGTSLVDFNRTSVPLVEIVSNPDFRTSEEVVAYLEKLRLLLSFAGVSDCKMQEGSMRCDVNVSVREKGSDMLGTRTEIKNMNSLKAISRAIAFETERHIDALETGCETLIQETRRWDDSKGESFAMREKENATDYRYFPNPELMPIIISDEMISSVRDALPESSQSRFERMTLKYGLPEKESRQITDSLALAKIFDDTTALCELPREVLSWMTVDLLAMAKSENKGADDISIDCGKLASLIQMVENKKINRQMGKKILQKVLDEDIDPAEYVKEQGLGMVADDSQLESAIRQILSDNPDSVKQYKDGNQKVVGFFVGKAMRELKGRGDPAAVNETIKKLLDG